METNIEKDCTALGGLFNAIINDMRGSTPIWEDFSTKATKLHSSLKTTLLSISSFLESFQRVADMATGTKGATKEIGSALTRLCIRHKSIENKLKSLTSCIFDTMVNPLQERLEEWKKTVAQLDKDHAKECKKARADIKKAASDTIRLQKKAKKAGGKDMQNRLDTALHDVNDKFMQLEDAEKTAIRTALIEERSRFCLFVHCFKPFVDHEIGLLTEVTHLQEILDNLTLQTKDPTTLPPSSEQVILDLKGVDSNSFSFTSLTDKPSPPSSPSSLGSRKSSMCSSINSINSSSSESTHPPISPAHYRHSQMSQPTTSTLTPRLTSLSSQDSGFTSEDMLFHRPLSPPTNLQFAPSQPMTTSTLTPRLTSLSSQDSGFTSQDMLFHRPLSPPTNLQFAPSQMSDNVSVGGNSTTESDSLNSTPSDHTSTPSASSTWTNWPDPPKATDVNSVRPHTISAVYEKTHSRPPLTSSLFDPPEVDTTDAKDRMSLTEEPVYARPATITKMKSVLPPLGPKPKSRPVPPPMVPAELPAYVNMNELANMAAEKREQEVRDGQITPVNSVPPGMTDTGQSQYENEDINIQEAIRDLENCTAAIHCDYELESQPETPSSTDQKTQNTLELADAIRELEASTAALQCVYNDDPKMSQESSGYDTMDSTPSSSEAAIAALEALETDDYFDEPVTERHPERKQFYTLPRNCQMAREYRANYASQRPASTAGILATSRRQSKPPPPPVRRSSSITAGSLTDIDKGKQLPRRASSAATHGPEVYAKPKNHHFKVPVVPVASHTVHKRSRSIDAATERKSGTERIILMEQEQQQRKKDLKNEKQELKQEHKHENTQQKHEQKLLNQQKQQQKHDEKLLSQQKQQQKHEQRRIDHEGVEHRIREHHRSGKERASCPVKSPPKVPDKQFTRNSENLGYPDTHYASPNVHRQASLPNAGIYGVPNLTASHADVLKSLSSKFASLNETDGDHTIQSTLKHTPPKSQSQYTRSQSERHYSGGGDHDMLPMTPEEGLYAEPVMVYPGRDHTHIEPLGPVGLVCPGGPVYPVLNDSHEEDFFPAPPSAEELEAMSFSQEYDV